ncbi:MAG: hypothetical protein C4582_13105 [Desulfobacteraceae bacterium]|jgi:GTPase Era involved in 16S rRNA processing|nr:MAG: hypothetical protein C4582_13105 [Desulfobacteraceae bacterium]
MKLAKGYLETKIPLVISFLESSCAISMDGREREAILARVRVIEKKMEELGSAALTIGFAGGTGVGKSTIMNALAGEEIAHTSHRRPDTDAVLLYRHASAPTAALGEDAGFRLREIEHTADSIRQIILCDLPDFDSLVKENRAQAAAFFEKLDMIVWVVSPEKYADARLYDLLTHSLKSKQNFIFVLNKTDILFEGIPQEKGSANLDAVIKTLNGHLAGSGIENPVLYAISARDAGKKTQAAPWNQFTSFKDAVFRRRDEKQILAIKAANLEEELNEIISMIEERRSSLEKISKAINSSKKEIADDRPVWLETGAGAIDIWIKKHLAESFSSLISEDLPLAGWPGRLFALAGSAKRRMSPEQDAIVLSLPQKLPPEVAEPITRHIEFLENRLANNIKMLQRIPEGFEEELTKAVDSNGIMAELEARLLHSVKNRLSLERSPGHFIFKAFQKAAYLLILLLFLAALASTGSWEAFLAGPEADKFFIALFSTLRNLFSASGLAAFLTYILISLFMGLRFYLKAKRVVDSEAFAAIGSLRKELLVVWEEAFNKVEGRVRKIAERIESEKASLAKVV